MKKTVILLFILVYGLSLRAQTTCGFEGTWQTDWDGTGCRLSMEMTDDLHMTGSYSYMSEGGTIYGNVSGTIIREDTFDDGDAMILMHGEWWQGSISGTFKFARMCFEKEFTGSWRNDNELELGKWNGTKD